MKKIISIMLAAIMCLSMFGTAFAAEMNFTDVKESDWFYNDVKSAVEMELVSGKSDTSYSPNDNLTYAEAIKLAACMNQFYTDGKISLKPGTPWYQPFVEYCNENGIIDKEYNFNDKATRAGYIGIFAKALPDEALKEINNIPDNAIPDVPSDRAYAEGVYKLYRAGIITGVDEEHNCNPLANIKRSEVAAILTRMMNEDKRIEFDMGSEEKDPDEKEPEEKDPEEKDPEEKDPEEKDPEEKDPEEKDPVEKDPEEKDPEEKDPDVKEPESTEPSTGSIKDRFQQGESEELKNEDFLMYVEDVYSITNKGVVATGRVVSGKLNKGDAIVIVAADGTKKEATAEGIEMFKKMLDEAEKGDNIGLLFNGEIDKTMVVRGDSVISADSSYSVTGTLKGTLNLISKEDGGRTNAVSEGHSPQFYRSGHDFTGKITGLTDGTINPGETQEGITVTLTSFKGVFYVGQELSVREGGRTIGTFTITSLSTGGRVTRPDTVKRPTTSRDTIEEEEESDTTSGGRTTIPTGKNQYMD